MTQKAKVVPMSQKTAKTNRKAEEAQAKADKLAMIEDIKVQKTAAIKARQDKLDMDFEYLHDNLVVVGEKYTTVEGYMDARQTFEQLFFGVRPDGWDTTAQEICTAIARDIAAIASALVTEIETAGIDGLEPTIIDGLVKADFVNSEFTPADVCRELLISNLIRNVEPAIEKVVDFREHSTKALEEFDKILAETEAEAK